MELKLLLTTPEIEADSELQSDLVELKYVVPALTVGELLGFNRT